MIDSPQHLAATTWTSQAINARLHDELLNGEIFYTLKEAQVLNESWRRHYNAIRLHSSLGYRPPAPEGDRSAKLAARLRYAPPADQLGREAINGPTSKTDQSVGANQGGNYLRGMHVLMQSSWTSKHVRLHHGFSGTEGFQLATQFL